ncbi:MAG: acyltransferase family protein, partial [Nitrospirota bacterium]
MKSSSGAYYGGLDHVRAIALFMVFTWHFIHVDSGQFAPPPVFPLSLLTEGHTGVALFITLSGYLFAKLLDGKKI